MLKDVLPVGVHGGDADLQNVRDFLAQLALSDKFQYLCLPCRQNGLRSVISSERENTSPEALSMIVDLTFTGGVWSTEIFVMLNSSQMFPFASVFSGMNSSVMFLNFP